MKRVDGMSMERRRRKRIELKASIQMERLDNTKQAENSIPIDIFDVSMDGLGFTTDRKLQLDSIYNVTFEIWTKETLKTIIKLVRSDEKDGIYTYGSSFVGMTDSERFRVEVYQLFQESGNA